MIKKYRWYIISIFIVSVLLSILITLHSNTQNKLYNETMKIQNFSISNCMYKRIYMGILIVNNTNIYQYQVSHDNNCTNTHHIDVKDIDQELFPQPLFPKTVYFD